MCLENRYCVGIKLFQILFLHTSTFMVSDFSLLKNFQLFKGKNSSEAREPRFSLNGNHAYEKNIQ